MNLSDYEETASIIDHTPRPKASQAVAAQKRAQQLDDDAPIAPVRAPQRQQLIVGIVGVLAVVGVIALAIGQHGMQAPTPLQLAPTSAPAQALETSPTAAPAPATAPIATRAPLPPPAPAEAALAAPIDPPQTGRGLTLAQDAAPPAAPAPEAPAPSYLDNVGAQAGHCVRTCGDGTWAAPVPTLAPDYAATIGAQAPHVVR